MSSLNYLSYKDFVSLGQALELGEQIHVNHIGCDAGVDTKRRLYIKRGNEDGHDVILAHCHHCGKSGCFREGVAKPSKRSRTTVTTGSNHHIALPRDFTKDWNEWPKSARVWLGPSSRKIAISTIEGIGPVYAAKLAEFGIETTDDLLKSAGTRQGRKELAERSGITGKLILAWVNRADLMRVPGVGEEFSDLLEKARVDTVNELKNRVPEHLHKRMGEVNAEKQLVRRLPSLTEVTAWIEAAKEMAAGVID